MLAKEIEPWIYICKWNHEIHPIMLVHKSTYIEQKSFHLLVGLQNENLITIYY
jgi:hypothetical protein